MPGPDYSHKKNLFFVNEGLPRRERAVAFAPVPKKTMIPVPTNVELEGLQIPDPSQGVIHKKDRLLKLAQEHGILRISAEKGINVDEATRFIETYADRIAAADFPKEYYHLLK